jgi:hypothetical protein
MTKADLRTGMIVKLRCGWLRLVVNEILVSEDFKDVKIESSPNFIKISKSDINVVKNNRYGGYYISSGHNITGNNIKTYDSLQLGANVLFAILEKDPKEIEKILKDIL